MPSTARINHILKYIDFEPLTDAQERLVMSFADQFEKYGRLSEKQAGILEDIFRRQNEN